jgi:hypothetical protein
LRLPHDSIALSATLYAQWATIGGSGLATTNALRLQLAPVAASLEAAIITSARATAGAFPASGDLWVGALPVLRLGYR